MDLTLLPPYSPMLTSSEWVFGMAKRMIVAQKVHRAINFSRQYGKKIIVE